MRWIETCVQVRFSECDPMGVVHHSNYYVWFEEGRYALAHEAKIDVEVMAQERMFIPVIHSECRYRQSARFGDSILVRTALLPPKAAKLEFQYQVFRLNGHVLLATGKTVHAVMKPRGGIIMQLPQDLQRKIEEFLAG